MEQIGEIVELRGRRALVRIRRATACGENCAQCSGECKSTATMVEASNSICAQVGDTVKMEMNSASFMLLAFIGYILPIIICIITYFAVKNATNNTVVADASAIGSLIAALFIFYLLDKLPRKSSIFTTKIVKILK